MLKAFLAIGTIEKLLVVLFWLLTVGLLVVIFTDVAKEFIKISKRYKEAKLLESEKNDNIEL